MSTEAADAPRPDRRAAPRHALWRALRVSLAAVVVVACAAGGALGVGSAWPSTRTNDQWSVVTRVTPQSEIDLPTSIGTATFDTHAWGPGARIEVSAQALPPVGRAEDRPFIDIDAQLDAIRELARAALVASAWKAAGGALLGGLLGGLLWSAVSGRAGARGGRRLAVAALSGITGTVACLGGWVAGSWLTFDEEFGSKLQADGLLAVGLSTERLLAELNARDQKYAGYVQSLSTYISRLRDSADTERSAEVAVRVMLISDVHGRNIYPQLAQVIENQEVDFVIDAGDLVQWGTAFELSKRPDLRAGIESLGVPYLFVKGNHDGLPTVEEIRNVPNVRVLEGRPLRMHGLVMLGVPDPRVYQDGGPVEAEDPEGVAEIERIAAQRAVEDLPENAPPVDMAVMHHPEGARELGRRSDALIWVSGHRHVPALDIDDTRMDLTVGTTGAAGIRTFNAQNEEGEVIPTPQSFDIIGFNSACEPVTLTRFSYPDALSDVGNALVTYQTLSLDRPEDTEAGVQAEAGEDGGPGSDSEATPTRSCD